MARVLRVYPNPWAARDKDGVPCGLCPRDPAADAGGPGKFVGARVDAKRTVVLQKLEPYELRSAMQRTLYEYVGVASEDAALLEKLMESDPIELPETKYYKERLRERALLPADKETAALADVRFQDPKALMSVLAGRPALDLSGIGEGLAACSQPALPPEPEVTT